MPIKFLKASGKGFFIEKEGYALAVREDLKTVAGNAAFRQHMKDILEYRSRDSALFTPPFFTMASDTQKESL